MLRFIFLCLVLTKVLALKAQDSALLDSLIQSLPIYQSAIAPTQEDFEIQVLYKPLSGDDAGTLHRWGIDSTRYFYPASTVKLPAAILALQWINDQQIEGLTPMSLALFELDTLEKSVHSFVIEPNAKQPLWQPSIANFIHDAMVVSDNEAYNRLFELVGPHYINNQLWRRGWKSRIIHKVGESAFTDTSNTFLPALQLFDQDAKNSSPVYTRNSAFAKTPNTLVLHSEIKGVGRYNDQSQSILKQPFDFRKKNFIALQDLAEILQTLVAPETVDTLQHFRLPEAWRNMLIQDLCTRPAESRNPAHHNKPDGYVNFLYYGGEGDWDENGPHIYNKVGDAYGYLTEAAIFEDLATGNRFLLAASIHVNSNGIYNDGVYEYETIGFPFMKALGKAVWEFSLESNE